MKHPILFLLSFSALALAQDNATPSNPGPTKQQVQDYAKQIGVRLEARKARATDLVNEIIKLDRSVQQDVTQVTQLLGSMTDSNESKTRVARTKRDLMERMKKAAEVYARNRAALEEQMRTTANPYTKEDLFKERSVIDDRINGLVDKAVALAATMDVDEGHDKYIVEATGDDWGGWDTVYRDNPDYEQNRRATRQTDAAVKDLDEALRKAIARMDLRVRQIEEELRTTNPSPEKKAALESERKRLAALRQQRIDQEATLDTGTGREAQPGKTKPTLKEAMQTEKLVDSILADTRRDFVQMLARYKDLRAERDSIADLKVRLDQCEEWLKKNP